MRSTKGKNLSMAVVRGGHPRTAEADFYQQFVNFDIKMIGDRRTGWINEKKYPDNFSFIHSPLYPVWGIDPWTKLYGARYVHRSFQFLKNLEKLVADSDVINISDLFYFYCWQAARLAGKFNKKLVAIVWENVPRHASTYVPPYCFGVRKVLQTADLFIARSYKARDYLLSIGAEDRKIKVVYKGIDLTQFKDSGANKKDNSKVRILYVGQLVKTKGVIELLTAFEQLCSEFANLELWLVGRFNSDPLGKTVRDYSRRSPIVVKAEVDYDKVADFYKKADIYCHLSQDWKYLGFLKGGNDWFPYAVLEAMASGLPVVATRVGGIPEQLGNVGNIFVKQKDVESVYEALKTFILDRKLREEVGEKNRRRAHKFFEIREQARKTEEAILELL